jgi:hypothetical protein
MAKNDIRNGQLEYGIFHAAEEDARAAGIGVFGSKNAGAAPSNKAATPTSDKSLTSMTKAELLDTAKAEGVAVETDDNKADLVRKIEAARK